ncbi:phenylcoumaran benzylic ether reductase POP1-like [Salvia splendens]|uniref:phenylcoumaran benzylic ether reductase POP1-like n=1 Tax=Salvia splendens TaxID=180675 RepID=UPI001C252F38|nr:phenylcoumaran benzylic ether reductase POP1-like [Salvia splendens]XP_042061204.1 phenylcoumaran benzylic ether reductase POP1-like [Salvia splendens]XP_042061205.1 phenylcoumaran benzylic ether reductase POP1-like [Salvia splendens]XP_042061206.1 phenylcoumaran benzylic ether reductase POP1-like [Salvia splendens]
MTGKSKILIIGGTGYIGKLIVIAAVAAAHPTFVLIRDSTLSKPQKSELIRSFTDSGVNFIHGDMYEHESLVRAIKEVDVVISAVGYGQLNDQDRILAAIKEAGNVKRFFPSEFGNDVDRVHSVEPATSVFQHKAQFRRVVEAAGVPYTYVSCNLFAGVFIRTLAQLDATDPPRDKVVILGDGNMKAVYNKEEDIATYTIKAVDDPRTSNKILYIRPVANTISMNDLTTLWENKIGKKLKRVYVPEEQVLKDIQEAPSPLNVRLGIMHSVYVKGDQTHFVIEPSFGVEASELYPDVKYTTVNEMLDQYV